MEIQCIIIARRVSCTFYNESVFYLLAFSNISAFLWLSSCCLCSGRRENVIVCGLVGVVWKRREKKKEIWSGFNKFFHDFKSIKKYKLKPLIFRHRHHFVLHFWTSWNLKRILQLTGLSERELLSWNYQHFNSSYNVNAHLPNREDTGGCSKSIKYHKIII